MIGQNILHYKIVEKLGEGGMGIVYLAEDTKLERQVAIKFLPHHIAANSDERKRFEIEAKAAAALNHPNIATIHAIEEADDNLFLVMEYIAGKHLKDYVGARHVVPLQETIDIATQIAKGLQAAHDKGITHRDIKSSNIMIKDDGQVKIMDFGLAKFRGSAQLTQIGTTVGTAAYMSPEQARGEEINQTADIWSFGVVLYEMLAGQLPFKGDYEQAVTYSIINENPPPLSSIKSDIPAELQKIVDKCLEKNSKNRYQHADEIIVDLRKIKKDSEQKEVSSNLDRTNGKQKKHIWSFILPAVLIVVLFLGYTVFFHKTEADNEGKKISIAVVDFINETDEKELNSLSGLLITALEQSQRLTVLTRSRMFDILDQMGKKDVQTINEKLGMEICKSADIEALAVATIRKLGNRYAIDLKILNPVKNEHFLTAKEEDEGQENIFAMIDRLAESTREKLSEKTDEIEDENQKVTNITTANLEAYKHYFLGEQYISRLDFVLAVNELKQAINLDSTFALAYYQLGYAYDWNRQEELAKEQLDKALTLIDRIPEKERILLHAQKAHLDRGYEAALPILKDGVKKFPNNKEILYNYGDFLYHEGKYEESFRYLEKVLIMDPRHERALDHIIRVCQVTKSFDKAIEYGKQYLHISGSPAVYDKLGFSYIQNARFDSALEIYNKGIATFPDNTLFMGRIGKIYMLNEEYEKAEDYFNSLTEKRRNNSVRLVGYKGLARLYPYLGKYRLALIMYDQTVDLSRQEKNMHDTPEWGIFKAWVMLWGMGRKEGVMKEVQKTLTVKNPGCVGYNVHLVRIYIDFNEFEKADSINNRYVTEPHNKIIVARQYFTNNEWEKAALAYKSDYLISNFSDGRYQLARCYYEMGQWKNAIEQLQQAQTIYNDMWHCIVYPKSYYLLGKIYEKKGDPDRAIANYKKFLDLWKDADPDLTELIDAKKRLSILEKIPS